MSNHLTSRADSRLSMLGSYLPSLRSAKFFQPIETRIPNSEDFSSQPSEKPSVFCLVPRLTYQTHTKKCPPPTTHLFRMTLKIPSRLRHTPIPPMVSILSPHPRRITHGDIRGYISFQKGEFISMHKKPCGTSNGEWQD